MTTTHCPDFSATDNPAICSICEEPNNPADPRWDLTDKEIASLLRAYGPEVGPDGCHDSCVEWLATEGRA